MCVPWGSWSAYEVDRDFIVGEFKKGFFDFVELVARVNETDFFQLLLKGGHLDRLAATFPSPRKKHDVPLWVYLASQISLKIHGRTGYGAYPHIVPLGGLRDALGPAQVERKEDAQSGERRDVYAGYNQKNSYARATPCHHDTLRKLAKDTDAERLQAWFGSEAARLYRDLSAYDQEGIFIVDGTYLFVPDNERYEDSSKMRFDEHNHPVSREQYEAMSPERRQMCQWRRCYQAVNLLHTSRAKDRFLFSGVAVTPGKDSETPHMGVLVDRFAEAVGRGVMKILLIDRGFIDGPTIGRIKLEHGVDVVVPLKKSMQDFKDAWRLAELDETPWLTWRPPEAAPKPVPPQRPADVQRAEENRQKTVAAKKANLPSPVTVERVELKLIKGMELWDACGVPINVVLFREYRTDGKLSEWVLATTKDVDDPMEVWELYQLRTGVEERHRQTKLFWDLTKFRSCAFSMVVSQVVFMLLAYSLVQAFLLMTEREELAGRTRQKLLDELASDDRVVAVYQKNRVAYFTVPQIMTMSMRLGEGPRRRAMGILQCQEAAEREDPELPMPP